ncbi:LamG-like jellyroll fold domain-containing protein [Herbiconiux sp. P17]|uniref:LamG-like jellyroll fold domain-containing protein n=1 Tax=Herbiconiux wuyangfengii TaxID=3342794 RepID=UPI0035B8F335
MKATSVLAAFAAAVAGATIGAPAAEAAPTAANTVVVHADQAFRPVTHLASGSLYGIADADSPSSELISAIKPHTFIQMPFGGKQQPTGDIGDTWKVAADHDANVVIRLSDYYAGWPYQFDWATWDQVVTDQVAKAKAAGITNLAAWAPWNESTGTWNAAKNGSFEDFWVHTYRLIRSLDPTTPIQGPSYSDDISEARQFFTVAKATDTLPDILAWHELIRSSKIVGDLATINGILSDLGIDQRPISIEEYAAPAEAGIPGSLVGYISKFERLGIHDAELPFWNQSGTLGDLLTKRDGVPNGAYWMYTWYADMSGDMVSTTPPGNTNFDATASVTSDKNQVEIITGGNSGSTAVTVDGLDQLPVAASGAVNVKLEYTPSYGRTVAVAGPITVSNTTYQVGADGSISVPITMNPAYGYHIVVTPAGSSDDLSGGYTVTNVNSGLALDTADAAPAAGSLVNQRTVAGSATQNWNLIAAGSGLYKIVNATSGLVLGMQTVDTKNNTKVVVAADTGTDDQLWQPIPDGAGSYRLGNYATGRVLAVDGMSKSDGAQVVQWLDGNPSSSCTAAGPRQPGKLGTAVNFCGTSAYVALPTGAVSSLTGDFSVSTWVNPASNATWQRVFDIGTGSQKSMFLTVNDGSKVRFVITTNGAGGEQKLISSSGSLPLNQWSLVTVTVSGTTGKLYVGSQLVATNTGMTVHPSDFGQSAQNYLGKSQYSSDPAFNGLLDDFNIYNRALTADEVLNLSTGVAGTGNVVKYSFDENTGASVPDSSGAARNGTIVNGTSSGDGTNATTTSTDAQTADHFWKLTPVVVETPDTVKPVATLVTPTTAGPFSSLALQVDASDDRGLKRIVANIYKDGTLVKSTQSAVADGALTGSHAAAVTLPDGNYTIKYNAEDLAGNIASTGTFAVTVDATAPTVTVKTGDSFTVGADGVYDQVSYKLNDGGQIDKVTINGVVKDLTNNAWSDVNFIKPGVFGAVEGANTLVVYDVAGNTTTIPFSLN